eukprot:1967605-Lingulodinium_polyedra.AAC.1
MLVKKCFSMPDGRVYVYDSQKKETTWIEQEMKRFEVGTAMDTMVFYKYIYSIGGQNYFWQL